MLHAGSADKSFTPQSKLVSRGSKIKSSDEHHSEMTYSTFKQWLIEQLLSYIPPCLTIVMDNASLDSVQINKALYKNTRKTNIIAWLSCNGIPHNSSQTTEELLLLVNANKPMYHTYKIDTKAMHHGHHV